MAKKRDRGKSQKKGAKGKRAGVSESPVAATAAPAARPARPFVNGMRSFAIHGLDSAPAAPERVAFAAAAALPSAPLADVSAETAAQHYLQQSLKSEAVPGFDRGPGEWCAERIQEPRRRSRAADRHTDGQIPPGPTARFPSMGRW